MEQTTFVKQPAYEDFVSVDTLARQLALNFVK
jgi:hypothetical protein